MSGADEAFRIICVLEQYFCALDSANAKLLEGVFADDAVVQYHKGTRGSFTQTGVERVVGYLVDNFATYECRTHARANTVVDVEGATARTTTHAVATLVKKGRMAVRGLRYEDVFVLTEAGWRIRERAHTPLWQFDAAPSSADVPPLAVALGEWGA